MHTIPLIYIYIYSIPCDVCFNAFFLTFWVQKNSQLPRDPNFFWCFFLISGWIRWRMNLSWSGSMIQFLGLPTTWGRPKNRGFGGSENIRGVEVEG